jgi:hypothetical protein
MMMSDPRPLPEPFGVMFSFAPEHDKDAPEDATAAIKILEAPFKGIVVRYTTVEFGESIENEAALLKFNYTIISGEVPDSKKVEFELLLGNMLHDILLEMIK